MANQEQAASTVMLEQQPVTGGGWSARVDLRPRRGGRLRDAATRCALMSAARPSVVHVLGRLDVGGAETMLLARCRATPAGQLFSTVLCLSGQTGELTSEFEVCGVREVLCGTHPLATFPYRFLRSVRRDRPDVVVSHVSLASGVILVLAVVAGVHRRVAVFHSDGDGKSAGLRRRAYRWAMTALLQIAATDVVGVTPTTAQFSGVHPTHRLSVDVIPNAVDMDAFTPIDRTAARRQLGLPESGIVLAHVGRAAVEKNRRLLPGILAAMPSTAVLALAGSAATDDLELEPDDPLVTRIHNLGLLRDVRPLFGAADIVILPSIREGFPVVILEALASGRAVVATDLTGVRSMAAGLPDVHLVPPGSTADQFADAAVRAVAGGRSAAQIREGLGASEIHFDTTLEQWMSLCQPRR